VALQADFHAAAASVSAVEGVRRYGMKLLPSCACRAGGLLALGHASLTEVRDSSRARVWRLSLWSSTGSDGRSVPRHALPEYQTGDS
jgi:hypothetical protein